MTASVTGKVCPPNQWTTLAVGKIKFSAVVRGNGAGRVVLAAVAPAGGLPATDYLTVNENRGAFLNFEDTTTNVYVWPTSETLVMEVVTE